MICMSASLTFTAVLTAVEGGWIQAQLRELPQVVTCAPTEAEARAAVVDALREYLASFTTPGSEVTEERGHDLVRLTIDAA
jgi:predicted RNase H-like HicB family nuclease